MDHPGHYFRRIKSVSLSLTCIAGRYNSLSAKLTLLKNECWKNYVRSNNTNYSENPVNDDRLVYNNANNQSIATSNAQNVSSVFELNFREER